MSSVNKLDEYKATKPEMYPPKIIDVEAEVEVNVIVPEGSRLDNWMKAELIKEKDIEQMKQNKTYKNLDTYFESATYGCATEVIELLIKEGFEREEAEALVLAEVKMNPDNFTENEDYKLVCHKEYGYPARLNQVLNGIREMIQSDVIQVIKSGHKPQILALRESLVHYISIIDEAEDDTIDQTQVN